MDHAIEPGTNGHGGHEHREANLSVIVYSLGGLLLAVFAVMIFVWFMMNSLRSFEERHQARLNPLAPPTFTAPGPQIQEYPFLEVRQMRAHEDDILYHYGWQDQKNGIVHIPIDKAMDAVLAKGPYGGKITPPTAPGGVAKTRAAVATPPPPQGNGR